MDFGNVAELSQRNKQTLIDAVVHAVNEDYKGMADDFVQLVNAFPFHLEIERPTGQCCAEGSPTFVVSAGSCLSSVNLGQRGDPRSSGALQCDRLFTMCL